MPIFGALINRNKTLGGVLERRFLLTSPAGHQENTLKRLLNRAATTVFGQYYDFREILRSENVVQAFQDKVPLFDYDTMHRQWWHMSLNDVENVTWNGRIKFYALSSGTAGAPSKRIPVSDDMQRAMRRAGFKMFFALPRFGIDPQLFTKGMMMLGGSSDLVDEGGHYIGDLSGINASKPPVWLRPYYKPGSRIARIRSWDERIAEIVKKAPEWDVGFIVGIPSWLQLMMERIIHHHQLESIHDIWPNLRVCVHGGVHFEPYRKGFQKLMKHPLIYMDSYLASEGFIAFQDRPDTRAMKMLLNNGIFFEFIPFNNDNFDEEGNIIGNPQTLSVEEVEENTDYALVLSTCSGAWRYLIGDTVRFTDKSRAEITISGRTKHYLSICGEHLSIDNMNEGVQKVEEVLNVSIPEFTVSAIKSGNFFTHKWYLGTDVTVDPAKVVPILDQRLKEVNDDYGIERASVLKDILVEVIPVSLFYKWHERQGKMGGQNKFPRVLRHERFKEWEEFVAANR
ncbi:MAG: GH3 family domain-containing protein [Saprospiraceae bacterium]